MQPHSGLLVVYLKTPGVGDLEFALSKLAFIIEEKWGVPDRNVEKFGYNMVFMPPTGPLPSASLHDEPVGTTIELASDH